ncbi:MAG TPA: DUF2071 domain-containing protein [Ohtaekwangia sp.]
MSAAFLTGKWKKLIMANYSVDPEILQPYVPHGTKLNFWRGQCYVTLTGFMFTDMRFLGIQVPFHSQVPEINFRFYVVPEQNGQLERGVVFIKEMVSRPLVAMAANLLYRENYSVKPVRYECEYQNNDQLISYHVRNNHWNKIQVRAGKDLIPIKHGSVEEFLSWQLRGYTKINDQRTSQFTLRHPIWNLYPIKSYDIDIDFGQLYGKSFEFLKYENPDSIFIAEGSSVAIMPREAMIPQALPFEMINQHQLSEVR